MKLMFKEIILPTKANKFLFLIAPMLTLAPALAAWAVFPFDETLVLADVNAGLLYVLALTSMGVYGVIIAGWATNSKYAFLGAMRSAAQIVSYEIAMGFALVAVIVAAGSLNFGDIVRAQQGSAVHWFWLPLFPLFIIYFIAGVAETNRAPFDVAEGESEIVAGFHLGVDRGDVSWRLVVSFRRNIRRELVRLGSGILLAAGKDIHLHVYAVMVPGDFPPLPL